MNYYINCKVMKKHQNELQIKYSQNGLFDKVVKYFGYFGI